MRDLLKLETVDVQPYLNACSERHRIPDFREYKFYRYTLELGGISELDASEYPDDDPEDFRDKFEIRFSSTREEPWAALDEMLDMVDLMWELDADEWDRFHPRNDYRSLETNDVVTFIKRFRPDIKSFKIDELDQIEEFKYLYYSTSKLAEYLLVENLDGVVFSNTPEDLRAQILAIIEEQA